MRKLKFSKPNFCKSKFCKSESCKFRKTLRIVTIIADILLISIIIKRICDFKKENSQIEE